MRRTIWALLFAIYLLRPSHCLAAAPQASIQVSPLMLEYTLSPGQAQKDVVVFFNPSSTPQKVTPQIFDFVPADEVGGLKFIKDVGWQFSASRWIVVDETPFVLDPQEEKVLPFVIGVPTEAEPGSHYAAIFGETQAGPGEAGEGSRVGAKMKVHVGAGTLILINVPGDVLGEKTSYSGYLASFEIQGLRLISDKLTDIIRAPMGLAGGAPLTFVARFHNTGTFHQKPRGEIEVFDLLGRKAAQLQVKPQRVLPGAIIQFKTPWRPWVLFGPYRAHIKFFYGKDNQFETSAQTRFVVFSAIPLGLLASLAIGILGIIVFQKTKKLGLDK